MSEERQLAEEAAVFDREHQDRLTPTQERAVLRANPPTRTPDWEAILDDIERRFPKTLARLAE